MNCYQFLSNKKLSLCLALLLAFAISACAPDQPEVVAVPDPTATSETTATITETTTITDTAATDTAATDTSDNAAANRGVVDAYDLLVTASSLLDYDFENLNGDVTGEIEDLLIDLNTGNVLFATLEYGGVLEIGDTELPVPLNAFQWGSEGQLILALEEERLQELPSLEGDWPDLTDPAWDDDVVDFWRNEGFDVDFDFAESTDRVVWASTLVNYPVRDIGLGTGTVHDLWIDLGQSAVRYFVLEHDAGVLADQLVAVPFSAFDMSAFANELVYWPEVDAATLELAPRLDEGYVPGEPIDPAFDDNVEEYWSNLGYLIIPIVITDTQTVTSTDSVTSTEAVTDTQ